MSVDRRKRRWRRRSSGWRSQSVAQRRHHDSVCQRRRCLIFWGPGSSNKKNIYPRFKLKLCITSDFPANNIVKFLLGFTNKGSEDFVVESLDASFRYPQVKKAAVPAPGWDLGLLVSVLFLSFQDFQFYIQNFTALQLGTVVPPARQATFEYSFIPAEPMGGRPFGLVINLNYKDNSVSARVLGKRVSVYGIERYCNKSVGKLYLWKVGFRRVWFWFSFLFVQGNIFQDAVFNQTVTITEKEDGLDGETYVCALLIRLGFSLAAVTLIVSPLSPPQHLHVRLPVGSGTARHHRSSSAAGVQKGRKPPCGFCFNGQAERVDPRWLKTNSISLQRRRPAPKVEMGTSSHNGVDLSWIPQETLNQISMCDAALVPRLRGLVRSSVPPLVSSLALVLSGFWGRTAEVASSLNKNTQSIWVPGTF